MDRRSFLKAGAASLAVGTETMGASLRACADEQPIRIGLMAPLTGVVSAGGREIVDGFSTYWAGIGNRIGGRKVEILVEDDASNPDTALQKARRLAESDKVDFLVGNLLANTGVAVANYVKGNGMPYFIPVIAADDLTQRHRIPNVIRVAGYSASQFSRPLADWALKQGFKRMVTISQDYTFGYEQCGGFCQTFTEGGGKILTQFWHPLNTSDFSPYLGQISGMDVDAIFAMETGADSARLLQQYSSFGLKDRLPLIGAQNAADQSVIRTMGPECEGVITAAMFAEGADIPATQAFVKAYGAKFGKIPSLYGFTHYVGAMWIAKAIDAIKGRVDDRTLFLDTVLKTDLPESPLGRPVHFDAYGNPVYDVFIRKVVKNKDGKYWNVPIKTYPQVSQFWTYDPVTYMKQPPYSRTFQGIKKD